MEFITFVALDCKCTCKYICSKDNKIRLYKFYASIEVLKLRLSTLSGNLQYSLECQNNIMSKKNLYYGFYSQNRSPKIRTGNGNKQCQQLLYI